MAKNPLLPDHGQQPAPFTLDASDDALITFGAPVGPGALSFSDIGYMPVNQLTISGSIQTLKGSADGLFIHYSALGVQHLSPTGIPTTADYTSLHYELVSYKGDAVFGHAFNGFPTVSGVKNLTVVAQGDLLQGHLGFTATGGIAGEIDTTIRIDGRLAGALNISVQHAASDITPTATGFALGGGAIHAVFVPT